MVALWDFPLPSAHTLRLRRDLADTSSAQVLTPRAFAETPAPKCTIWDFQRPSVHSLELCYSTSITTLYDFIILGAHAARLLNQQTELEPAPEFLNQVMFICQGLTNFRIPET